jgi:hypothetical protein
MSFAAALSDNFIDFIQHVELNKLRIKYDEDTLDQYILAWLECGDAVIEAGGDFGTYMQGVVHIINRWHYDTSITDYCGPDFMRPQPRRERRVQRVSEEPRPSMDGPLAFNRDHFMSVLYRRMIKGSGA